MAETEQYLCVDPSGFSSPSRLNDLLRVLETMSQNIYAQKTNVIIPSLLYDDLIAIKEKRQTKALVEIFASWLPIFYNKDHIEEIVRGLSHNPKYIELLGKFFDTFTPLRANNYVKDIDKLGERSIFRDEVRERLGEVVGTIIFEMLAISNKLRAKIVGFTDRTVNLIIRLGVTLLKAKSEYKKRIKLNSGVRRTLRIIGYVLILESFHEFVRDLQLPNMPPLGDIGLGILLVADG